MPLMMWKRALRAWFEVSTGGLFGWPDATNTGLAGVGLTVGDLTPSGGFIATPGQVIERLDIAGAVIVPAESTGVVIRECRLAGFYFGVDAFDSIDLTVEDCDVVGGQGNCGIAAGTASTVRRCNISGGSDGMKAGGGLTLVDNYIHDLFVDPGSHNDGVQFHSIGPGPIVIRHNWIDSPDTSCIAMFAGDVGEGDDILIEDNYFAGNPGYCLYLPGSHGTNLRVLNNRFTGWDFWAATDWYAPGNVWSGNTRTTDGSTVGPTP